MLSSTSASSPTIRDDLSLALVVVAPVLAAQLLRVPWWLAIAATVVAVASTQPSIWLVAVLLLCGLRADAVVGQLEPVATHPVERASVQLVDDPRPSTFGKRAVGRMGNANVLLSLPFGTSVDALSAGDRVVVSGTQRGQRPNSSWAISRRIVGQIAVTEVHSREPARGLMGAATSVRRLIKSGASSLSPSRKVLLTGLVFGDDRGQDVIVNDNFRAAGLGHLLAVSGQNVVFVLVLASPLISRLRRPWIRVAASLGVLACFGTMTRFEPSVTRAIAMAAIVLVATAVGRPANARIVLAPAVAGLVLIEPTLAWSLAFQLSVSATLGLVVLAPRIETVLRGPEVLRAALAATISAQLAVSPLILANFGALSLIAIPANVLAVPVAGAVMMWGLVAGPIAGLGPSGLAHLLHLPTRLMLWWIDGVARAASGADVGRFTVTHLAVLLIATVIFVRGPRSLRRWGAVVALVGVCTIVVFPRPLAPGRHQLVDGLEIIRSVQGHDVLIIDSPADEAAVLASLRQSRLGRIDLVISLEGGRRAGRLVAIIANRHEIVDIWAPHGHRIPSGRVVEPMSGAVGTLRIDEVGGEILVTDHVSG